MMNLTNILSILSFSSATVVAFQASPILPRNRFRHTTIQMHQQNANTRITRTRSHNGISSSSRTSSFVNTRSSTPTSTSLNAFDLMMPSTNILSKIDTFYQTAPYMSAFVTCGIKASAADLVAQKRSMGNNDETTSDEQLSPSQSQSQLQSNQEFTLDMEAMKDVNVKDEVEVQRNIAFILYGGLYQGIAQQYIYNYLFPQWFGTGTDIHTVLTKVIFDLIVISPLLCIPIAYLVKAVIYGQTMTEGLEKYVDDVIHKNVLLAYYCIWFPTGLCSFGLVPDHLRIAFIAFVSFFWLIILSTISSSKEALEEGTSNE